MLRIQISLMYADSFRDMLCACWDFIPMGLAPHPSGHLPFIYRFNDQSPTVYTYIKTQPFYQLKPLRA